MKKILLFTVYCLLFTVPALAADGYLSDPMTIGVGARSLGMGKAFVGVAEDGDAVFMNPAGLARSVNPKLSTMYSSLLGDVNYAVVGGAYPLADNKSAIGAGIINSRVTDIPLTDATGASLGTGTWGNSVMFLSYGTYLPLKLGRDILVGASLKYFSVGGDGATVADGAGTGYDVDLGVLVPATDSIMLGANFQNALPASLGGKITKTTGTVDSIPAALKLGAKVNLIGREGMSLSPHANRKLYWNLDYDLDPAAKQPNRLHTGVEFWPVNNLALRVGSDNNDITAGVGVRLGGVEFNYAYHPYGNISENTTHFFSVGYLGETRKRELRVKLDGIQDKAVVYEDNVKVSGRVEVIEGEEGEVPAGPLSLKLNGVSVALNPDNTFSADVALDKYGKKMIVVEASSAAGDVKQTEVRLVRLTSFADVPEGYWAKHPIEDNATVGLVNGYPDGSFRPEKALSRAELATLLVRAKGIKLQEGRARQIYKDVKPNYWAAKYIDAAAREGLIKGYPDKTFRPNNKISKVEGIVVMTRFDQLKLAEVDAKPYWDVSTTHWAARQIQAAKDAGLLKFVEKNRLRPKEVLARSESVDMLAKTSLAGGKIKDLYTWEKGFQRQPAGGERPQIKASLY